MVSRLTLPPSGPFHSLPLLTRRPLLTPFLPTPRTIPIRTTTEPPLTHPWYTVEDNESPVPTRFRKNHTDIGSSRGLLHHRSTSYFRRNPWSTGSHRLSYSTRIPEKSRYYHHIGTPSPSPEDKLPDSWRRGSLVSRIVKREVLPKPEARQGRHYWHQQNHTWESSTQVRGLTGLRSED